jgi:hypothetical protein
MPYILPLAILALVVFLLLCMPWRHADPRHEFMFEMCERLAESMAAASTMQKPSSGGHGIT